jgi:hypothetical protein
MATMQHENRMKFASRFYGSIQFCWHGFVSAGSFSITFPGRLVAAVFTFPLLVLGIGLPGLQKAATYTVNNTGDAAGPFTANAVITLREALTAAAATSGTFGDLTADAAADTIVFSVPPGSTINLNGFLSAANGNSFFAVNKGLTLDAGSLAAGITIHRNSGGSYRFFEVAAGGTLTLKNITFTNGAPTVTFNGGAFLVSGGSLTMSSNTTARQNSATNGGCLAVTSGAATVNGRLETNNATTAGGAIFLPGGSLTLQGATVINNTAQLRGGGIAISGGTLVMGGCTISSNTANGTTVASDGGGGIFQNGGIVTSSGLNFINRNSSVGNGGGATVLAGSLSLSSGDEVTNNVSSGGNGGGLNFAGGTGHVNSPADAAPSPPNVVSVIPPDSNPLGTYSFFDATYGAVDAHFARPMRSISIDVRPVGAFNNTANPTRRPYLQAFDAAGNYLGQTEYIQGAAPHEQLLRSRAG